MGFGRGWRTDVTWENLSELMVIGVEFSWDKSSMFWSWLTEPKFSSNITFLASCCVLVCVIFDTSSSSLKCL